MGPLALQMSRNACWDLCSGAAVSRHITHQDLSAGCCKPSLLFPISIWYQVVKLHISLQRSPWDEIGVSLPGSILQLWPSWRSTLGSFLSPGETVGLGGPSQCGAMRACRKGDAVKVKVLLFHLQCGPSQSLLSRRGVPASSQVLRFSFACFGFSVLFLF